MKLLKHQRGFLDILKTIAGPVIGAIGSVAAGVISSASAEERNRAQIQQAQNAMMFSDAQVSRQMDFQERMSGTAHQRQVTDLRAAGLNPILSARYGGSSTPSGGAAQGQQANIIEEEGAGVASAQAAMRLSADVRNINEDVKLKKTQIKNLDEARRHEAIKSEDTRLGLDQTAADSESARARVPHAEASAKAAKARLTQIMKEEKVSAGTFGTVMSYFDRIFGRTSAAETARALTPVRRRGFK